MSDIAPPTNGTAVLDLNLNVEATKAELAVVEPEPTDELRAQAEAQVAQLLAIDPTNDDARAAARDAVDSMGRDLQTRSATRSRMLQAPLKEISHGTEDGGEVAKSLSDLRIEVEKLDPSGLDTDAGWFTAPSARSPASARR